MERQKNSMCWNTFFTNRVKEKKNGWLGWWIESNDVIFIFKKIINSFVERRVFIFEYRRPLQWMNSFSVYIVYNKCVYTKSPREFSVIIIEWAYTTISRVSFKQTFKNM